jgi:hypothetical protein
MAWAKLVNLQMVSFNMLDFVVRQTIEPQIFITTHRQSSLQIEGAGAGFIFLICWFLDFHRFPQSRW